MSYWLSGILQDGVTGFINRAFSFAADDGDEKDSTTDQKAIFAQFKVTQKMQCNKT